MQPLGGRPDSAAQALRRAALARERAERELAAAARQDRLAERTGMDLHKRLARLHRDSAACQSTAARLQEAYARLLTGAAADGPTATTPGFMASVAEVCGTRGAALSYLAADRSELAVAASDEPARAAQELEFLLGEGPARDAAVAGTAVRASGTELCERWPVYGTALAELGFDEVAAVPLRQHDSCVGSLTVFDPRSGATGSLTEVADALTRTMVLGPQADPGLYGGTNPRAVVHQAAGMVSVHAGCAVADALELVKARAFSEGLPVDSVAERIVRGELLLG
ncbi:GAF and ANTAR domain-containing protein [Streptomyces sp. NPDC048243]|uniref:GAF and ANTAR domain-containing protein n=1 Tax=unclassified Streptomyces TaxID=2593676 RepID=UPI003724A91B